MLMFELAGSEPGLCKAPRAPELQDRAVLTQGKFPGWVRLGCDLCVGRGVWLSLQLSVQACSEAAARTRTSWFNDSLATLHYAVTPLTALQIFAGLCSGVWPLHPGFGGCRSWIKLCLGCSFYSAPLREPKKKSLLLVSTKNYREPKLDEKQNNLMHSEKADIKTTVRNSVLCL